MEELDQESYSKHKTWRNKLDFLFACVASGVGLGNVWRFPYLCYINGGGAFLIPYIFFVVTCGLPLVFLEIVLGQYTGKSGIMVWNICPILMGCGVAGFFMLFLVVSYYNVIVAWILYYLFSSFNRVLPWSNCDNEWNTQHCFDGTKTDTFNCTHFSNDTVTDCNITAYQLENEGMLQKDPVSEFWENKVLHLSQGISHLGIIKWDLALCLLLAYVLVYLCIWKGIKDSQLSLYITVCTPYLLLTVMVIRGLTLQGSLQGIKYYLLPNWGRLLDSRVWADAGTQVFFSYAVCIGIIPTLASYNSFNRNCLRDALIFSCVNSFTSIFAGFVIFTMLGFMAHVQEVSISEIAESGPGLAFIAYPKALAKMPLASLWSVLFFLMLLLLGLGSMLGIIETLVASFTEVFSHSLRRGHRPKLVLFVICVILYCLGLPMVTHGGMYVLQLFDFFVISKLGLLIGCLECFIISYCYGIQKFSDNVRVMLGHPLSSYFKANWMVVTQP